MATEIPPFGRPGGGRPGPADWSARIEELVRANPMPVRDPASAALGALLAGDGSAAAQRIAALARDARFVATLVLDVAATRRGVALEVLESLGQARGADTSHVITALTRTQMGTWAREVGMRLSPDAVVSRDDRDGGQLLVAVVRAACEVGQVERARAVAERLHGDALSDRAEAWAVIGLASEGEAADAALARAAEVGNQRPWIQDGGDETYAHSVAMGRFARGGLAADHPAVQRVVSSLMQLGQVRAYKDGRSHGVIEAAKHAAERARRCDDAAWRAIAERLRDRAYTESLREGVDAILAGTPLEQRGDVPDPRWSGVWDALLSGDADQALQILDATADTRQPDWVPQYQRLGDILPDEPAPTPPEPRLDADAVKLALKGAATAELEGLARRVDPADEAAVAHLVKACGLKKHRGHRADLRHVVSALCLAGLVDAAIDAAYELVEPTLHGYELKDAIEPLAADLAAHPERWTDERRARVVAALEAPDPSFVAHVLLSWVEADAAADPRREAALVALVHRRFDVAGDRRAGELAVALGLCRVGHALGPERMEALAAAAPVASRLVHPRKLFGWLRRRTLGRFARQRALATALRLCMDQHTGPKSHDYAMGDLQRGVLDIWRAGFQDPVVDLLGCELPAPTHRDLRRMIWVDAVRAPDPLMTLWAAWPRDDDGPQDVRRFVHACVVTSNHRSLLRGTAAERVAAVEQLRRVEPLGWSVLVDVAADPTLSSKVRAAAAAGLAPPIPPGWTHQGAAAASPAPAAPGAPSVAPRGADEPPNQMVELISPQPSEENFLGLRSIPLGAGVADLAMRDGDVPGEVFGVLMDTATPEGIASLACLADGTTSKYLSNGDALVGGGSHETIRAACLRLVELAQHHGRDATPVTTFPTPAPGGVCFYFLMSSGEVRRADGRTDELREGRSPLSDLLYLGEQVVIEMRLITERRDDAPA